MEIYECEDAVQLALTRARPKHLTKMINEHLAQEQQQADATQSATSARPAKPKLLDFVCIECSDDGPEGRARAFFSAPPPTVVFCANRLHSAKEVEETMVHELIHAYDFSVRKMDITKPDILACSEIRSARESECYNKAQILSMLLPDVEFFRNSKAWLHRRCVREHAVRSTRSMFPDEAREQVEKMFDQCYADENCVRFCLRMGMKLVPRVTALLQGGTIPAKEYDSSIHTAELKRQKVVSFTRLFMSEVLRVTMSGTRQASDGPNMNDPKVRATLYMQSHGIKELFDGLATMLLFHRPAEPRVFLTQHLAELQRAKQNQTHVPFFEEQDLEAMFAAFDVNDRGFITPQQYDQALRSLGIDQPTLRLPESISQINQSLFTRSMTQELKNASTSLM